MKCPHCLEGFHSQPGHVSLATSNTQSATDVDGYWSVLWERCPACSRLIIVLWVQGPGENARRLVHPRGISRSPLSADVPEEFAVDYTEACVVLADSPKASAALSRRCLQNLIRHKVGIKKPDLSKEIDEVLASKQLPSHLAEAIDAIRNIGNFAAHPLKSTNSGEVVDVEPGEAEWILDTLEGLFDFYFVQPAILKRKRDALNQKLTESGKPPMK